MRRYILLVSFLLPLVAFSETEIISTQGSANAQPPPQNNNNGCFDTNNPNNQAYDRYYQTKNYTVHELSTQQKPMLPYNQCNNYQNLYDKIGDVNVWSPYYRQGRHFRERK